MIPLYTAGMRFINLSDDQKKELATFIEGQKDFSVEKVYKVGDPGELRCSIRFLVDPPFNKAVLKVSENYAVKKISLGGMLIESEVPLKIEEKIPMEMLLPGNTQIRFSGRIASCLEIPVAKGPEEGVSRYDIGIEFLEIGEEDREKLRGFVAGLEKAE